MFFFLVLGPYDPFMQILGSSIKREQIPSDSYQNNRNLAITLEKEFSVHKIWAFEEKVQETTSTLTVKELASNDIFFVAGNSKIAYILILSNMNDVTPILPKAKGL